MNNSKNLILWIEAFFAVLSIWVLFMVDTYPENGMFALRLYILILIVITLVLVLAVRYYQSQHSAIDIDRICEMVEQVETPAFIWSSDLSTLYTNEAMDELLGIGESEDPGDSAVLLSNFFHSIKISPRDAAEKMVEDIYESAIESESGRRSINWATSLLKQASNASLYFTIGFETTELEEAKYNLTKKAEDLTISQRRYQLSMKLSGIGILLCETMRDEYYVSDEAQQFLGIQSDHISFEEFRQRLHPDDRLTFDEYLENIRHTRPTNSVSRPRSLALRISAGADKHYVWYAYHYHENLLNSLGRPIIGGALIDITTEKQKDAIIEKLAFMDEITEIANRNKLMHDGEDRYRLCQMMETFCWVIVIDIDRFHIINDSYGYDNGDKILKTIAHVLCKYTAAGGFAARVSADNFVLVLQDYSIACDDDLPIRTIEHIREDLSHLETMEIPSLSVTCSAGFARMPQDGHSFHEVLEHAEFALAMGRGELSYMMGYDAHMHEEIIHQGEMEKQLAQAIEHGELQLYYQPKVEIRTKKIMGAEALIRWIKPDGSMISPNVFIPLAEKTGMISQISQFVLREAVQQTALWHQMKLTKMIISINFASGDFYQANVCETVQDVLVKHGLQPEYLELELTERLALGDINYTVQQMTSLRDLGIKLAMDDFGTGYSSLSYIQLLPLTLLKLDRSFIIEIERDKVAQEICSAVIKIARSMEIETIAEGVEYEGQADILRDMGCDYIQGYLYGKPMSARDFEERLRQDLYGKEL
ncbi:MAG: bifunctional diguanylate cyclase/phosphodiesterase [Oscillospiraceae bacterium]|nr:bifunctional diguanylate cyclase/phosphodiesterase [Oscillospiraceae bacterium]